MTKEQEEAIEKLEHIKKEYKGNTKAPNINVRNIAMKKIQAIETVLSMLKEKDKLINEQLKENVKMQKELNEENKRCMILANNDKFKEQVIDLMAEYISKIDIEEDICIKNKTNPDWCNEDYTNCKNCIKQYFERKVEE